jgi:TonB family protein
VPKTLSISASIEGSLPENTASWQARITPHFVIAARSAKQAEFHRVKRLLILSLLCCAPWIVTAQIHVTGDGVSGVAEYAPYPKYPDVARWRRWAGNGMFACHLRPDGTVLSVEVLKSTGYDVLDQAAIAALRQWHFKMSGGHFVRVPIKFAMRGVRHRMSGAVIYD